MQTPVVSVGDSAWAYVRIAFLDQGADISTVDFDFVQGQGTPGAITICARESRAEPHNGYVWERLFF